VGEVSDPELNADAEIEKHLYAVDAKYNNVFRHTPHTKEDLINSGLEE
jgi:hypothetical protein